MTRASGSHLSADELDACLSGVSTPEIQQHLDEYNQTILKAFLNAIDGDTDTFPSDTDRFLDTLGLP